MTGPLTGPRRMAGIFGLLTMIPIGMLLAKGSITPLDAGIRAAAVLVAVQLLARMTTWSVVHALRYAVVAQRRAQAAQQAEAIRAVQKAEAAAKQPGMPSRVPVPPIDG